MHVGRPQVAGNGDQAGVAGLQRSHLAGGEDGLGPDRTRHAGGEEQCVLLVVLRAAQGGDGGQHAKRQQQHGPARFQLRINHLFARRWLDAPRATVVVKR